MKERGMIFNGEMVRAILDGRKTQTRRIMAPQPADDIERGIFPNPEVIGWKSSRRHKHGSTTAHFCHYGKPGDRIWVRETWGVVSHAFSDDGLMIDWVPDRPATAIHEMPFGNGYHSGYAIYAADGDFTWGDDDGYEDGRSCWKPSIHMPRAASRILLEITDVRVERLNAISQEDAQAEGMELTGWRPTYSDPDSGGEVMTPYDNFAELWSSIYGEGSWKADPWVWVIEFKRVEGGAA
ncbi:Morphogenetic protein [Klebsiella pneumoniae]